MSVATDGDSAGWRLGRTVTTSAGDDRDPSGNTALILAASYSSAEAVDLLLDRGADVNALNWQGHTALMKAAWFGSERIVRTLVARGVEIAKVDRRGCIGFVRQVGSKIV